VSTPRKGTHIHVVEQVQPQGMKKQRTKQRNTSQQQKLQLNFTDNTMQQSSKRYRLINATLLIKQEKQKYPNISHNTTSHSAISSENQRTVKEEFLTI
jgi:hypothetical protein